MFGAISEKFRTFDMQINCAIPPNFSLFSVVGRIFFPFSKLRNPYHFVNQFVRKAKKLFGQFTTVPIIYSCSIANFIFFHINLFFSF